MGRIEELPPTFTTETALSEGISPRDLYTARDAGEVVELSRGVFRRSDAPPASYEDLLATPAHPEQARPAAQCAINAISQGLVDIRTQVFPLAEAAEAHRRAENGSAGGRILLAP